MNAPDEAKGSAARQTLFCLCFFTAEALFSPIFRAYR